MPIPQDIDIWRGNDGPPISFPWPAGYAGSTAAQLTVWVGTGMLFAAEGGGALVVDQIGRRYLWAPTLEQSRLIPAGRIARYELEDQSGGEVTLFYGTVCGRGGDNLDLDAPQPDGALNHNSPAQSGLFMMGWI